MQGGGAWSTNWGYVKSANNRARWTTEKFCFHSRQEQRSFFSPKLPDRLWLRICKPDVSQCEQNSAVTKPSKLTCIYTHCDFVVSQMPISKFIGRGIIYENLMGILKALTWRYINNLIILLQINSRQTQRHFLWFINTAFSFYTYMISSYQSFGQTWCLLLQSRNLPEDYIEIFHQTCA
jgi:hypothetical protein